MRALILTASFIALASTASAQTTELAVTLKEWKVELSRDTLSAGRVTFRVTNAGTMTHGFYVSGPGVEQGAPDIQPRESATLTVTLKPGTYEVYCPMSDMSHRAAGMTIKLTVKAATPPR